MTIKGDDMITFFNQPQQFIRPFDLTNHEQRTWCAIAYYYEHNWAPPTYQEIADLTGFAKSTITRQINVLVDKGYLRPREKGSAGAIALTDLRPPFAIYSEPDRWPGRVW